MADGSGNADFSDIEQQYGLPPGVLTGLFNVESSGGKNLGPSSAGAVGNFQFMPATIADYEPQMGNLRSEADAAGRRLRDALRQHGGDLDAALADYGGFRKTDPSGYIKKVRGYMAADDASAADSSNIGNLDLDALTKTALSSPDTSYVDRTIKRLEGIEADKEKAEEPYRKQLGQTLSHDVTEAQKRYEGIEPIDVQPWTQKMPERDPMQTFGSIGSIFAIMASAFTHQPMINALNGSAAAMNAIKAGDRQAYEDAFESWKVNTKLAIDRHNMQHNDYLDAVEKMRTDLEGGEAAMRVAALKYGDQATLVMTEAGLLKDRANLIDSRNRAAVSMLQLYPQLEKSGDQHKMLMADPDWQSGDPARKRAAYQRVQQAMSPFGSRVTAAGSQEAQYQQWHDGFVQDNEREPTFDESLAARNKIATANKAPSGGGGSGISAIRADAVRKQIDEFTKKNGRPPSGQEEADMVNRTMTPVTGNEREKLEARSDQIGYSMDKIEDVLSMMDKHILSAGVAGRATRMGERVGNVFGSDSTDRVQLMRDIEYLQMAASRILLDTAGRPLSSEAGRISDIIGGLNLGDTMANTQRSLQEVRDLYDQMRGDVVKRLGGEWKPPGEGGGGGKKDTQEPSWKDAPLVQ